ncbi:MAG: phosphate propanoyltransferase [Synergistaceae bacterium]
MQDIVSTVLQAIDKAGLVQVEVSAKHVHLSKEHIEILFGNGATLTKKRPLSQPGQFLCEERVKLIGPKGSMINNVAVLGPERKNTQVELSKSDCFALGVSAPVRDSGDVAGSGSVTLEGPCGTVTIPEGVIIASRHVHVPAQYAASHGLKDKQIVSVEIFSDRPVILKDVLLRVSDKFSFRMHIDFDEANGSGVEGFTLGRIIK